MLDDPRLHFLLSLVKGIRNGLVYGAKVRFPHSLVIALLYGKGPWPDRLRRIIQATKTHATKLALFVLIYKSSLQLLRSVPGLAFGPAGLLKDEASWHALAAGALAGALIFGDGSPISQQINLYLMSRVLVGVLSLPFLTSPTPQGTEEGVARALARPDLTRQTRSLPSLHRPFAMALWALALWLHRYRPAALPSSLGQSMDYLYLDSEWWTSLRTLLWHNK
ncbi:hypothetical protein H696_01396 [Fonticula alba]|uniref:Peroxisomal membrane protein 4 n=1 Tax=Fonticula alba TaxID=691883 RepID=A0A058ZC85_FONAL|nr:hypothetical protein H696_01396 [Fonticula alba]KCV71989.1 hypothetical protein H696_01396 [Fonticula alba]|eukprot:XP_009493567.1 hypothetical protein H696_01396 [Fonticula alba]